MRQRMKNCTDNEEKAIRCIAHGIAHARDTFGDQRLAKILGTIAIDLAELADTNQARRGLASSGERVPTAV